MALQAGPGAASAGRHTAAVHVAPPPRCTRAPAPPPQQQQQHQRSNSGPADLKHVRRDGGHEAEGGVKGAQTEELERGAERLHRLLCKERVVGPGRSAERLRGRHDSKASGQAGEGARAGRQRRPQGRRRDGVARLSARRPNPPRCWACPSAATGGLHTTRAPAGSAAGEATHRSGWQRAQPGRRPGRARRTAGQPCPHAVRSQLQRAAPPTLSARKPPAASWGSSTMMRHLHRDEHS